MRRADDDRNRDRDRRCGLRRVAVPENAGGPAPEKPPGRLDYSRCRNVAKHPAIRRASRRRAFSISFRRTPPPAAVRRNGCCALFVSGAFAGKSASFAAARRSSARLVFDRLFRKPDLVHQTSADAVRIGRRRVVVTERVTKAIEPHDVGSVHHQAGCRSEIPPAVATGLVVQIRLQKASLLEIVPDQSPTASASPRLHP